METDAPSLSGQKGQSRRNSGGCLLPRLLTQLDVNRRFLHHLALSLGGQCRWRLQDRTAQAGLTADDGQDLR